VLMFGLGELRESFGMRGLVRRGVPIRTPTYEIGEHMIWGATARILGHLLERLYREVRAPRIYEGASEVQRTIIARGLLKESE